MHDGEPIGHVGTLRPNNLGLKTGVYLPGFKDKRLISSSLLMKEGWAIHQINERDSYIEHRQSGKRTPLSINKNLLEVPYDICYPCYLTAEQAIEDMEEHPTLKLMNRKIDDPIPDRPRLPRLKINTALDLHQRLGHLTVPGNEVECPECLQGKGQRKMFQKYAPPSSRCQYLSNKSTWITGDR